MSYSLYSEIRPYLKSISKIVLDADESSHWESEWQDVKGALRDLAERCEARIKERRETDRRERAERRALAKGGQPS